MRRNSLRWLLTLGMTVWLLPGPVVLAEEKKAEEKQTEEKEKEGEKQEKKAKAEQSEKEKQDGKQERPFSMRESLKTQTAPQATQTQTAPADVQHQPGVRVVTGWINQVRKGQRSLIIRDNLTQYQVFILPDSVITRGGKPSTFDEIEINDKVDQCRFNIKKGVQEIALTPARKPVTPSFVPTNPARQPQDDPSPDPND